MSLPGDSPLPLSPKRKAVRDLWKLVERVDMYLCHEDGSDVIRDEYNEEVALSRADFLGLTNTVLFYLETYKHADSPSIGNNHILSRKLAALENRFKSQEFDSQASLNELKGVLMAVVSVIESDALLVPSGLEVDVDQVLYDIRGEPIDFFSNDKIRQIILDNLVELKMAVKSRMHKSAALLVGSLAEALLFDVINQNRGIALAYLGAKGSPNQKLTEETFASKVGLRELLFVARKEELLSIEEGDKLIELRDAIHPNSQLEKGTDLNDSSTLEAIRLLRSVKRQLADSNKSGKVRQYKEKKLGG